MSAATFDDLHLAPPLEQLLRALPKAELHVHLEELDYVDHACLDLIANWEKQHTMTGGKLYVDWQGLEARFRDRESRRHFGTSVRHHPTP